MRAFRTPFVGAPPGAGSGLQPACTAADGSGARVLAAGDGSPAWRDAAKTAGLINTVAAPEAVEAEAMKAAREIAALPPQGVLASRRLMRGEPDEIVARIDKEAELFRTGLEMVEARAAFEAFMTRKK